MRKKFSIISFFFLLSCSSQYEGSHNNISKFQEDLSYCIKQFCSNHHKSKLFKFPFISSLHAYGGGLGNTTTNKVSYKSFNLCMESKGYYKVQNGSFEMPILTCK